MMSQSYRSKAPRGFTLVELLVVMSIILLLVALMLPAFSVVRTNARKTKTTTQITALESGLEYFRGEAALGATLPPSRSDSGDFKIANPRTKTSAPADPDTEVCGAHLLVHALVGADVLGAPGFRDLDFDGKWSDDTHGAPGGAYEVDQASGSIKQPRFGGGNWVDEKMIAQLRTLQELEDDGTIPGNLTDISDNSAEQPLFVDPWNRPILYYRANQAALAMVTSSDMSVPGVYTQQDNALITGSDSSALPSTHDGIDFGYGMLDGTQGLYHRLKLTNPQPPAIPVLVNGLNEIETTTYDNRFAQYIFDRTVKVRNTPVRKDSYLLISAGPDGVYGNSDDVVNWTVRN